jgi:[protein-PII] uridylyltransferase
MAHSGSSGAPLEPLELGADALTACRTALEQGAADLTAAFRTRQPIETLVRQRAALIDRVVRAAWQHYAADHVDQVALLAVGGYGRGELHPHSDIDLMVLLPDARDPQAEAAMAAFITFLWDIGLEVGHSVRTLADCDREARDDVTVLTTLLESRLLAGPRAPFDALAALLSTERMWPPANFFRAKVDEQILRHHRYHDTAYNLEPNVKGSPGGLRDIQMIGWLALRYLGTGRLSDLVDHGFLTHGQLDIIKAGRAFLWRVRFGLHVLTGRREDRLLFDHQVRLAQMLGYEDARYTLAVEQLMQRYYRTVMELSRLNEMLVQLFEAAMLLDPKAPVTTLNARFQSRNGYLEVVDEQVFQRDPSALLELFLLLEQNLDLRGVNAHTIGLVRQHRHLIDEEFRQSPRNHRLFLEILNAPQGVTRTLKRMNTYGVLGLYIPAFGRIVGRMQYDLFHAYTVDAHTLFVVENLRRLSLPRFDHELPEASRIMQNLPNPQVAYLAGLFHDIAKGRGGDHSELGAVDAEAFCLEHGMSRYDARLVAWLVRHHLLLSITAQKKDINDPDVIGEFGRVVGDQVHLDYLYVLTVSDVRGTNPNLWNSWKATLFQDLYRLTKGALRRGLEHPIDLEELVADTQTQARALLHGMGIEDPQITPVWRRFTSEYFVRYKPGEIAWHTEALVREQGSDDLLVDLKDSDTLGGTAILVYAPFRIHSFSRTTAVLDQMGLNILDARIVPTAEGHSLDTYTVLDSDGYSVSDPRRIAELQGRLLKALTGPEESAPEVTRRAPRQVRMFSTPVRIGFSEDVTNSRTVLELVAGDQPGLLSRVGQVLRAQAVELQNAKIMTVGERAEDVFFVTTHAGEPLPAAQQDALRQALLTALDDTAQS